MNRHLRASKAMAIMLPCFTFFAVLLGGQRAAAQREILVEDFEFATSDAAARAGVIDLTSRANRPAFYIFGNDENASPNEPGGLFSIGTDAVFCLDPDYACESDTFIGFRRLVDPARFPDQCPGEGRYIPLDYTYGDPSYPGPVAPDFPLSSLVTVWDAYGDGGFADGLTGTHLWLRLVDCEGEKYEWINESEPSLYSELWTFDVIMGRNAIRLAPETLTEVPNGDRLLTEISSIEMFIQDSDFPPTTVGKWYVDYLRVIEPAAPGMPGDSNGDGTIDLADHAALVDCLSGPDTPAGEGCEALDMDEDGDVDLRDVRDWNPRFVG